MTTYRTDNSALVYWGQTALAAANTELGLSAAGSEVWFQITGNSLQLNVNCIVAGAGSMSYSIDGGATFTAYNFGSTGIQLTTDLIGGGADATYNVVIRVLSANFFRFIVANAFDVQAAGTPSLQAPADNYSIRRLSDTAVCRNMVSNTTLGGLAMYHTWETAFTSVGYSLGAYQNASFGDQCIVFRASCTKIAVLGQQSKYRLFRDGVEVGSVVSGSSTWGTTVIASAEDGTEHEYKLVSVQRAAATPKVFQVGITGTWSSTPPTISRKIAFIGDSTTANTASTNDSDQGFVSKLIGRSSLICFNRGISGNTSAVMDGRINADVLGITGLYAVVCTSGANDSAVADATLQATLESMYGKVIAYDGSVLCYAIETFPGGNREGAVISAAVTAVADARCTYTDTDGWIDATIGVDTHDGIHPNNSGGEKLYTQFAGFLVPASGGGGGYQNLPLLGVG